MRGVYTDFRGFKRLLVVRRTTSRLSPCGAKYFLSRSDGTTQIYINKRQIRLKVFERKKSGELN